MKKVSVSVLNKLVMKKVSRKYLVSKKVSVSVLKTFGLKKSSVSSQKIRSQKSLSIGLQNIWSQKKSWYQSQKHLVSKKKSQFRS